MVRNDTGLKILPQGTQSKKKNDRLHQHHLTPSDRMVRWPNNRVRANIPVGFHEIMNAAFLFTSQYMEKDVTVITLSLILKFMNCVSDYYLHQHTFANAATTETQGCFCLPLRNAVYIKLICNSKFVLKETHLHFLSICSFSIMRKRLIAVFIWRFCPKSISHLSSSLIYPFRLSFSWRN